ncbi:MAG: nucleotide sugar dehydrogenase [Burkholderiaceae bacterium]
MPLSFSNAQDFNWTVRKIAVVGPGIVGMPMAALLAQARIREGQAEPARIVVVQRDSPTSGWKVAAINAGKSVIGGVEPGLDEVVSQAVAEGILSATHDYDDIADADMVLISVQTDKEGFGPDYGPLFDSLDHLTAALLKRPAGNIPVVVFESTLAPSSMATVIRERFARAGLVEGRDVLLGNSPNRVMPGRLVERVAASDKLVAGLHPLTPVLIRRIYGRIVTRGRLHQTNSMTAEVVKTLENAYRDVRIAFAAELVRYCDDHDIDFYALRDEVNRSLEQSDSASGSATAVPSGAILVPSIGVGGHCLPKDGILLWWRRHESGADTSASLILRAREINDASPAASVALAEAHFGCLSGKRVALLGVAYRFDSEDTRNSPTLSLAALLRDKGCQVRLQDPYVKSDDQNLRRTGFGDVFSNDVAATLADAQAVFFCVGHGVYQRDVEKLLASVPIGSPVFDGANLFEARTIESLGHVYAGIGRGSRKPAPELVVYARAAFDAMERSVANELLELIAFLNEHYAQDAFNRVSLDTVRELAGSCVTGCVIAEPGEVDALAGDGPALRMSRADAPVAV